MADYHGFRAQAHLKDQYSEAAIAALGQNGKVLAARVIAAVAMGPVYAWFLLANGLNGLVDLVWDDNQHTNDEKLKKLS